MGKPTLAWIEGTEARPGLARLWSFLDGYLKELAGDDFEVVFAAFPRPAGGVRQAAPRLLSEAIGLATARAAVEAGAELVVYNDWAMPIHATRSLLDVPVTGVAEASAVLGNVLAQRPAVVTVAEGLRWGFERDLRDFGAAGRMAQPPVWWLDPQSTHEDVQEAVDRPDALVGRFDAVAQRAVAAGADAILVGCGYFGPVLSHAGYTHVTGHPDVPVYDCTRLAYELGATLHRLHAAGHGPSRRGFPTPPAGSSADAVAGVLDHLEVVGGERRSLVAGVLGPAAAGD
jgi:Asp/Glu/hydantoin racemase